jgi:hypothetical protein
MQALDWSDSLARLTRAKCTGVSIGGGFNVVRCGLSHILTQPKIHNSSTAAILFDTVLHCLLYIHCCFVLRH